MSQPVIPPDFPVQLTFPIQNIQILMQGLGQLPYNAVAPLIQDIKNQTDSAVMTFMQAQVKNTSEDQVPPT